MKKKVRAKCVKRVKADEDGGDGDGDGDVDGDDNYDEIRQKSALSISKLNHSAVSRES